MNIILVSSLCKKRGSIELCLPSAAIWFTLAITAFTGTLLWAGYQYGVHQTEATMEGLAVAEIKALVDDEREKVDVAQATQQAHLDALALHVASIQAHLMRVDALGDRLVSIGKLNKDEFDFSTEPALGGLESEGSAVSQDVLQISSDMEKVTQLLKDREQKLVVLETLLINRDLKKETLPSGRPVKRGWMSSSFGSRTDPFSGKKTFHRGVDFAGKKGNDVIAVASGVVTRSEKTKGYGNIVEIRHADGYSTRYGHNDENLVEVGQVVEKGETVALLGNTGRSSGPHVHFEVHRNGRAVNPRKFIRR